MDELRGQPLFTLPLTLHPADDVGATPGGVRRAIPFSGGSFEGARLRGVVQPHGGHDWLLQRPDGATQQDGRATLKTDDGAIILASYRGVRHLSGELAARQAQGERIDPKEYYHPRCILLRDGPRPLCLAESHRRRRSRRAAARRRPVSRVPSHT